MADKSVQNSLLHFDDEGNMILLQTDSLSSIQKAADTSNSILSIMQSLDIFINKLNSESGDNASRL